VALVLVDFLAPTPNTDFDTTPETTPVSGLVSETGRPVRQEKPKKPYPDFPLFAHNNGQWCKKIRGKQHYFGSWSNPDAAIKLYLEQKDYLYAGETPRPEGLTVADICEQFFAWKEKIAALGEIKPITLKGYEIACTQLAKSLGNHAATSLCPQHFELYRAVLAKTWQTPITLGVAMQRTRTIFKWAYEMELLEKPVRYGQGFKKPSRKAVRQHQQKSDAKLPLTTDEVHQLLQAASPRMQAFILLGLNSAFGNTDISEFNHGHLKHDQSVVDYPRPKTAIPRTSLLWPETTKVLRREMSKATARHDPIFVTSFGHRYIGNNKDMVYLNFRRLFNKAGLSVCPDSTGSATRSALWLTEPETPILLEGSWDMPKALWTMPMSMTGIEHDFRR
jgi:integrase